MQYRTVAAFFAALLFSACEQSAREIPQPMLPRATPIVLTSVPVMGMDSLLPEGLEAAVAIDANGAVAWVDGRGADPLGTFVTDTTANPRVVRFGQRGGGPGELQNPWFISLPAEGPLVFESSGRRLAQYARDGSVSADRSIGYVVGLVDSHALVTTWDDDATLFSVAPGRLQQRRRLTLESDSLWRDISMRARARNRAEPYAASIRGDTVYIASTISGDLFRVVAGQRTTRFGSPVPPRIRTAQELDTILALMARPMRGPRGELVRPVLSPESVERARTVPIRQTSPFTGLQIDGEGRMWRFRDANNGPVADIFRDTVMVQQLALPCSPLPRGAHVSGRWLILACADSPDRSDRDVVLYRFRF